MDIFTSASEHMHSMVPVEHGPVGAGFQAMLLPRRKRHPQRLRIELFEEFQFRKAQIFFIVKWNQRRLAAHRLEENISA